MKRRNFIRNSILTAGAVSTPIFTGQLIAENKKVRSIQEVNDLDSSDDRDF